MSCALCGAATRKDAPTLLLPSSLAGQVGCDWCAPRLGRLAAGSLPEDDLAALLGYARRQGNPVLIAELEALASDNGASLAESEARAAAQSAAHREAVNAILATSGFNFEGFRIDSYLDFVSAEVVMGMGIFRGIGADFADFFGSESQGLSRRLQEAKAAAFDRLRQGAHGRGGNAIIGIDLDYTMFGATLVGVIASGTAVVIHKLD